MRSVRDGYLTKEGGNYKSWKRRWFVLDPDQRVRYYENVGTMEKGSFSLRGAGEIKEIKNQKKFPNGFEVHTPARAYRMMADNRDSMEKWIAALIRARDHDKIMAEEEAENRRREAEARMRPVVNNTIKLARQRDEIGRHTFPRLLHIQGGTEFSPQLTVALVPNNNYSVNDSDVYILDNLKTVYTWLGPNPNPTQQQLAAALTQALNEDRGGFVLNVVISGSHTGSASTAMGSMDAEQFWNLLGGRPEQLSAHYPTAEQPKIMVSASWHDFSEVGRGYPLDRSLLDPSSLLVVDLGFHIYIWCGSATVGFTDRDVAVRYTMAYKQLHGKSSTDQVHVERLLEGDECQLFNVFFSSN